MKQQSVIIRDDITRRRVADVIAGLPLNLPWSVTWGPERKRRSLNQNALYWKVVSELADNLGYLPEEMHEVIKQRCVPPKVVEVSGRQFEIRSTAKLDTAAFATLMDQVYAIGAEMGIYLPSPEELGRTR